MYLTLHDVDVKNKRVLLRVDFNVPLDEQGNITNDKRIREALPTIRYLLDKSAKIIILTHVGRPDEKSTQLSTESIALHLGKLLGKPITQVNNCIGNDIEAAAKAMKLGDILMLENVRFHDGEKSRDKSKRLEFARQLASLCDIYINDAFANSHRDHASMALVPLFVPGCIGLSAQIELEKITNAMSKKERPFISIVGGLKADKLTSIRNLLSISDHVLLGGALATLFLNAKGYAIGKSRIDTEGVEQCEPDIIELLKNNKLVLPVDCAVARTLGKSADIIHTAHTAVDHIPEQMMVLDIGPMTIDLYKKHIASAKTIIWNGPMGAFEIEQFERGTKEIAYAIARAHATSIVGGGDSATAVEKYGLQHSMTHVATGGGALLMLLEGKKLPAITALEESCKRYRTIASVTANAV